jgi:hypothetical protein
MRRSCRVVNVGQVVGCHSNSLKDGKGGSYKAHDIPAFLCNECHDVIDGRNQGPSTLLPRQERELIFLEAVYESMLWLLESGRLEVA